MYGSEIRFKVNCFVLQDDLWRQAQGRRPQFRLLAAKYIHKTVRTDAGRAPFDWL